MADYVDAVYGRHFKAGRDAAGRSMVVHDLFRSHETKLLQPLLDYLTGRNDIRLLGTAKAAKRAPTVAVVCQRPGEAVAADLARHGIMCWGGDFYAPRPLKAMGVDPAHGVLRLSFVHYTSAGDVDRLMTALDQVL
jgi:selenocysteine lyase/cysteine desulfurase